MTIFRRRRTVIRGRWDCATCHEEVVIRIEAPKDASPDVGAASALAAILDVVRDTHEHRSRT